MRRPRFARPWHGRESWNRKTPIQNFCGTGVRVCSLLFIDILVHMRSMFSHNAGFNLVLPLHCGISRCKPISTSTTGISQAFSPSRSCSLGGVAKQNYHVCGRNDRRKCQKIEDHVHKVQDLNEFKSWIWRNFDSPSFAKSASLGDLSDSDGPQDSAQVFIRAGLELTSARNPWWSIQYWIFHYKICDSSQTTYIKIIKRYIIWWSMIETRNFSM